MATTGWTIGHRGVSGCANTREARGAEELPRHPLISLARINALTVGYAVTDFRAAISYETLGRYAADRIRSADECTVL